MPKSLETKLRTFFKRAKVPSSPALAVRILELAEDPNSTIDHFADVIQMDPALAARLIAMTNSAACGQRSPVASIQRAVALLGINRVRTVSLGFQLVSHLDKLGRYPFDMPKFWQNSVLRACLAQEMAEAVLPGSADEAFLIGLLQDCGVLVLVQLLGQPYADLCREGLPPAAFHAKEIQQFEFDHVQVIEALAREWHLPEELVFQLSSQHRPTALSASSSARQRLAAISYLAGSIQFDDSMQAATEDPALARCAVDLGLDTGTLQRCMEQAADTYRTMGELLGDILPDDLDVTDLLNRANGHLMATMEVEREQSAQQRAHLEVRLGEYRELAARDPLTGVLNRGALTEAVQDVLQHARAGRSPVMVLFVDLDDFKRLNDSCGHASGDVVLKAVARLLSDMMPNAGVVGRYGGEEFICVLLGLTVHEGRLLAEDIVHAVRNIPLVDLGLPAPVTCSVGAVWATATDESNVNRLASLADEKMYEAKRAGKNRCCFEVVELADGLHTLRSDTDSVDAVSNLLDVLAEGRDQDRPCPPDFVRIAREMCRDQPRLFIDMRKQARKPLIVPCELFTIRGPSLDITAEHAYVRNISTGGIGLLTGRRVLRGQAVEILLTVNDACRIYAAGMVAFCRHVEAGVYEVGVQLFAHAERPILSEDPASAMRNLDWVAEAVRCLRPAPVGA